ncbi:uncharacterized protein LOC125657924 [Ostrea edulis]|uniref:uncharacterized protein LOC125657924 n=1 Tax=Ostrea edulis TaxID=37623 RepID=UPI002094FFCB|nr:uncharacterized protein LOC125657924 [Ostrea edulis]
MAASQSSLPITSEISIPVASIEHVYEDIGSDIAKAPSLRLHDNIGKEQLRVQIQDQGIKESEASKPLTEFATYHNPYTEETVHSPGAISKLSYSGSVKSKHVHTRQLNVFIGEEIEENIHSSGLPSERRVYSCPPTPRALKRTAPVSVEPIESASVSTAGAGYEGEPMRYYFLNLPEEEPPAYNEFLVKLNPYNKINHMIHGALHCPCFFFFFLFCCMPAVFWMQLGDKAYKNGDVDEAKLLGRKATVSYCIGAVLGVSVLTTVILISVYFVQDQLGQ